MSGRESCGLNSGTACGAHEARFRPLHSIAYRAGCPARRQRWRAAYQFAAFYGQCSIPLEGCRRAKQTGCAWTAHRPFGVGRRSRGCQSGSIRLYSCASKEEAFVGIGRPQRAGRAPLVRPLRRCTEWCCQFSQRLHMSLPPHQRQATLFFSARHGASPHFSASVCSVAVSSFHMETLRRCPATPKVPAPQKERMLCPRCPFGRAQFVSRRR